MSPAIALRYPAAQLLLILGVLLAMVDTCRAQADGTAEAASRAEASTPMRLLWLAPADPELSNRVRGQLVDTVWQVIEQGAAPELAPGDREAQLSFAFRRARVAGAAAVAWVQEGPERITVLVLDVAQSRLSAREIPRPMADLSQQSAAFETAALIVRATLLSIESGMVVGDAVSEPAAAPSPPVRPAQLPPVDQAPERTVSMGPSAWARFGYQVSVNFAQPISGPALGAGVSLWGWRTGVAASWMLRFDQQTNFETSGASYPVQLSFWKLDLALLVEHQWRLSGDWAWLIAVQPGVSLLHREAVRSSQLASASAQLHALPAVSAALGFSAPTAWEAITPELTFGVQMLGTTPKLAVGPAPEVQLASQMSRFEPWARLALRFP